MPTCRAGCSKQKNALIPARKALRGGSGQKKVSFPARNGIPTACRAEKHSKSCAEGAPRRLRAEKGIISCAEQDANRLLSRKTPKILRGRCFRGIWCLCPHGGALCGCEAAVGLILLGTFAIFALPLCFPP